MSSGISRISCTTVPAFSIRSLSFWSSSLAFADEAGAKTNPAMANAPAKIVAKNFLFETFIPCLLFPSAFGLSKKQKSTTKLTLAIRYQDDYTANQRQRSQDGRKRHGVVFLLRRLNGADVQNLLLRCVRKPLIHQCEHSKNNQDESERLHFKRLLNECGKKIWASHRLRFDRRQLSSTFCAAGVPSG